MSTVKEIEDRLAVMLAAVNPRTGKKVYEDDNKYLHEVSLLQTQLNAAKAVEGGKVNIQPGQLRAINASAYRAPTLTDSQRADIELISRAQGAKDKDGRRYAEDSTVLANLQRAHANVLAGNPLPESIRADVVAKLEQK